MPSLVKVRSFLGVAEAELARVRLAMDGIPARLSNAEFVSWAWYYSNATGGVKLFVNEPDAPRAAIILAPQPVPEQFQPPQWNCPQCQAEVDGLWSYCWSCGTSKTGEADPDFHTWYRESGGSLAGKSYTEVISVIISVVYLAAFLTFKNAPAVIFAWLITLISWVLTSRFLSLHDMPMFNAAAMGSEPEDPSPAHYKPWRDEFNPADDMAYRFWKAAVFSIEPFIFFPFALWLWYKTATNMSPLSATGLRRYCLALILLTFNIMFQVCFFFLIFRR